MSISPLSHRAVSEPELADLLMVGVGVLRLLEALLPDAARDVEAHSLSLSSRFHDISECLHRHGEMPPQLSTALSSIVTDLQFQDRNTQLMQDAVRILSAYRTMLEEAEPALTLSQAQDEYVARILSHITLSDVRRRYSGMQHGNGMATTDDRNNDKTDDGIEIF